jgi:hypothetical protein
MSKARGPLRPDDLHGPSNSRHQSFSSKPPLRSRVGRRATNFRLARGFPSARGTSPAPPDRSIDALTRLGRQGQRVNPRHADSLTPPGNPAPALCGQPATVRPSPTLCVCCAEWAASFLNTVLPAPVLPPCRAPRGGMATPSRSVRPPTSHSPRTMS